MHQRFSPFPPTLIALGLLVMASSTTGAELIEDVEIGIGGQFKLGHWTPLQVRLHSSADLQGQVEVTVEDGDATAAVYQGASPVSPGWRAIPGSSIPGTLPRSMDCPTTG